MTNEHRAYAGLALLIFLLGGILGWTVARRNCERSVERPAPTTRTNAHPDSLVVPIKIAPIPISLHAHSTIHQVDSTLGDSVPHIVTCLDTLISTPSTNAPDTLRICYDQHVDSFAVDLRFAARDTNITVRYITHDSIIEHTQIIAADKKAWYVEPAEILGSLLVGFLLGGLRRP
jgi:hypothetical protein